MCSSPVSPSATDAALAAPPDVPNAGNTSWELAKRLKADGLERPQMLEKLKATGLDEESAIVLINSVAGAMPAGIYTKAWLEKAGLWEALKPKVVPAESVRAAMAVVESGNAEAGIVYKTDAAISKEVAIAFEVARLLA